jgi:hypothetical protein
MAIYFTDHLEASGRAFDTTANTKAHTVIAATSFDAATVAAQEASIDAFLSSSASNSVSLIGVSADLSAQFI